MGRNSGSNQSAVYSLISSLRKESTWAKWKGERGKLACGSNATQLPSIHWLHNVIDLFFLTLTDSWLTLSATLQELTTPTSFTDPYQWPSISNARPKYRLKASFYQVPVSEYFPFRKHNAESITGQALHCSHESFSAEGTIFQPLCCFITSWWSSLAPWSGETCLAWPSLPDLKFMNTICKTISYTVNPPRTVIFVIFLKLKLRSAKIL